MRIKQWRYGLLGLLLVATLTACGGGGGDSATANTSDGSTGTVSLMLTDGPSDDYDQIWITVSEARLQNAEDDTWTVFYKPETPVSHDLLNLRPEDEMDSGALLAMAQVPVGRYSKIRLTVEEVWGVNFLPDGGSETTEFKLSSGKIDLNPQGAFEVTAETSLAITIDIDCDKSIHISGNNKNFRPVVFVEIEPLEYHQRCPRIIHGTITALTYADDETTITGFELTVPETQIGIPVLLDEATIVIDDEGAVTDPQTLALDDSVYVRGTLQEDGLLASIIVLGELPQFEGIVETPVTDNQFTLTDDVQTLNMALIPDATLILWGCDTLLTQDAIQNGMRARVFGKVQGDDIIAVAVLLRPRQLEGELTAMAANEEGHLLTIETTDAEGTTESLTVFMPTYTPVDVKFDGDLTTEELVQLVNCAPRTVRIPIDYSGGHPLTAAKVQVLPEPMYTTALSVDTEQGLLTTEAGLIRVKPDAHVFNLTLADKVKVELADIDAGDMLLIYGLSLCPASQEEAFFDATIILILPEMPSTASV